jgi:hypothetical protein
MKKTFKKLSKRAKRGAFAAMTKDKTLWAKKVTYGKRTSKAKKK